MDLILWRHAQAHDLTERQSDLERSLTDKGQRQARLMAAWLKPRLAHSTRVLVSPARRTIETVNALGREFSIDDALSPQSSPEDLLAAVGWPGSIDPVLVVGHQPTLGRVAARLLGGVDQPWHIKKAAVWWLRHRERDGQTQVILQAVQNADALV